MVTTTRDKGIFLFAPGKPSDDADGMAQRTEFILVVEDDAPTLRLERVILEEEGYEVEVVGSGEAAVEVLKEKSPTLILLDIGLPGMDGFAACQRIREVSRVPIIMVTGRDCLDDKVRGMDVGADDYVTKPFLTHELATRIKVVLRRSSNANDPAAHPVADNQTPSWSLQDQQVSREEQPVIEQPAPDQSVIEQPVVNQPVIEQPAPQQPADGEMYEGTTRLMVSTPGPVRNLINFVGELRQNPQFRLLRLVANQQQEGMDIWLGLREPMPLRSLLREIEGVSEVTPPPDVATPENERRLNVLLG